jgi:hypothetical protein
MNLLTRHLFDAPVLTLFISLSLFGLPAVAQTPDGRTPAEETMCDGLEDNLFGICNAYCEAMDCDSPDHEASDNVCQEELQKWSTLAGDNPLPCNELPCISLQKPYC